MTIVEHWLAPNELISRLKLERGTRAVVLETEPGYYGKHVHGEVGTPVADSLESVQPESCHLIVLADVIHQAPDRRSLLDHAKRLLAEGGRLVVVARYPEENRLAMKEVLCALEQACWTLHKLHEDWKEGFVMVLEPTDESVQS